MTSQTVAARPAKGFFVNMITRDISLEDCIFDLIDNSVDAALCREGSPPLSLKEESDLSKYCISIRLEADRFSIQDNCGGMPWNIATGHAFAFGRPDDITSAKRSIGVYGIGMKRAVFKIGRRIRVVSTWRDVSGESDSFAVPINVAEWLADPGEDWNFAINPCKPLSKPGVRISVKELTDQTGQIFQNEVFVKNLRRQISRDYMLHLASGLRIKINGTVVPKRPSMLRYGGELRPARIQYDDEVDPKVQVEIIAGMAAPPPDDVNPGDGADTGERQYGWFVVCNGRVVVAADKTSLTGWGASGFPLWHRQYSGFRGMIFFTADDPAKLPLTTTKRNVDTSSGVYKRALVQAKTVTREWIDYTNRRTQAPEETKKRESDAVSMPLRDIPEGKKMVLPFVQGLPQTNKIRMGNVHYSVSAEKIRRLAEAYGDMNMSYRDVGLRAFKEAYEDYVDD